MKIRAVHTSEFGVLGTQSIDFKDDWSGDTASLILLSGPNGCGKSTLLKEVSMLRDSFGYWLQKRAAPSGLSYPHGGIALVLEQLPFGAPDIIVYMSFGVYGDEYAGAAPLWVQEVGKSYPDSVALGLSAASGAQFFDRSLLLPTESQWFDEWTHERQRMFVTPEPSLSPNILFLDAEERRWVTPIKNVGEIRSENLQNRWVSKYQATEDWNGQVESVLLNMKVSSEERFNNLIDDMNRFLRGKKILKKVKLGVNRLNVQLNNDVIHSIDKLSAGERQVLILLYMVDRWLEKGGVALIDEPDLFLHPSLISGFLAQLERMVKERDGQLIITSHVPEVWERYETLGTRVILGADA